MDLLKNMNILLRFFVKLVDGLGFMNRRDLGGDLLIADSDLFDEAIGKAFLRGFSSRFGLFVFIFVGMVLL